MLDTGTITAGQYTTRGKGKRLLKLYGTNKLEEFCKATLKYNKNQVERFM